MTLELTILAWTLVLAIVQILLPATFRTKETGTEYNAGPRDDAGPPVGKVTARLRRAQENLYETLPLFAAAVLIAHVAGRDSILTHWGVLFYFIARIIYIPLYGFGIPKVRSMAWIISMFGLALVLIAVLKPA